MKTFLFRVGILSFAIGCFTTTNLAWSDAGWSLQRPFGVRGVQVYSETEHPSIALEKEFLLLENLEGGNVKAIFQFRNTSDKLQQVDCAFPIRIPVATKEPKDPPPKYISEALPDYKQYYFFAGGIERDSADREVKDFLEKALILPIETPPFLLVMRKDKYPKGGIETEAGSWIDRLQLSILWNGNPVEVKSAIIDYGKAPEDITVHLRFALGFDASQLGVLKVQYSFPTWEAKGGWAGVGGGKAFAWNYIIGTAGTWKGGLKDLVLVLPRGPTVSLPTGKWDGPHPFMGYGVYRIQDWKPTLSDEIIVKGRSVDPLLSSGFWYDFYSAKAGKRVFGMSENGKPLYEQSMDDYARYPVFQDFVKDISASSYLKEKTELFLNARGPQGLGVIIRPTGFEPQKAFDGLRESAWVPAGGKNGIGEWIQFTLTRTVRGISIQNGFPRVSPFMQEFMSTPRWVNGRPAGEIQSHEKTRIWEGNARLRTLEILRMPEGQSVATLEFKDQMELQDFPQVLEAGTYRMVIRATYPGTKWQDVGLGEIRFFPWDKAWIEKTSVDEFFSSNVKDLSEKLPLWDRENLPD